MAKSAKKPTTPPRVSLVSPDETKHDRFTRLANQRAKPIIKYLRMLGRLGAPGYDRTSEDIDKIEAKLKSEVEKCIARLRGNSDDGEPGDIL
jgi:hypothetical protein